MTGRRVTSYACRGFGTRPAEQGVTARSAGTAMITRDAMGQSLRARAIKEWKDEIGRRRASRAYRVPQREADLRMPAELREVPSELAGRFFQLDSGHAMTAPFLRRKFG